MKCGTVLTILDKTTGTKLYQCDPLDSALGTWRMIKMIKNTAVVCDGLGNICFIKNENQEEADRWTVYKFYDANLRGGVQIDGNNDYLAIGTWSDIYLWDVKTMKLVESSVGKIKATARGLKMIYPFVFVVGVDFMALQVYNLETGECIRNYQYNDTNYYHYNDTYDVQTNGTSHHLCG